VLLHVGAGLGVALDRIGRTDSGALGTLGALPDDAIARAPVHVKLTLQRMKQRKGPAVRDPIAVGRDRARVAHELALLNASDKAFQTTNAAAQLLQELVVHQALLEQACEELDCPPLKWKPPENPKPSGVTKL
jgi:hypothetical protein